MEAHPKLPVSSSSPEEPTLEQTAKLKDAAEQGDAEAQFSLGLSYDIGNGVAEDHKEAVRWYTKAAEQGHADAQYRLGFSYHYGYGGVIKDKVQAYAWYNIAAANGDEHAKRMKAWVVMTKEQIAEAEKLSTEMIKANPKLMGD